MLKKALFAAAATSFLITGMAAEPAEAAIKCHGPNQVSKYGLIRTPYCEDTYLAYVAGYSPAAVRHNPNIKQEACKLVGHYPRVSGICEGYGHDNFFRR